MKYREKLGLVANLIYILRFFNIQRVRLLRFTLTKIKYLMIKQTSIIEKLQTQISNKSMMEKCPSVFVNVCLSKENKNNFRVKKSKFRNLFKLTANFHNFVIGNQPHQFPKTSWITSSKRKLPKCGRKLKICSNLKGVKLDEELTVMSTKLNEKTLVILKNTPSSKLKVLVFLCPRVEKLHC